MTFDKILLDHGSGGKISHNLTTDLMLPVFDNPILADLNDGAILDLNGQRIAFSTDTYTVDPIFFPGGSIGDLAINGTVNDIAMCGGIPRYLSVGFILEEGFPLKDLEVIIQDMGRAARKAGVAVVTGDTKVVPKGAVDKIFINTSGVGLIPQNVAVGANKAKVGDKIILSGSIADHGVTILTQREGLTFNAPVLSDSAPLNHLVEKILSIGSKVHVLRDPTRGGVGTALNEIAIMSKVEIKIIEGRIPVKKEVSGICELLGLDPLYVANEGKLLAFVDASQAESLVEMIRSDEYGSDARVIGEVVGADSSRVCMETSIGGQRIVDMLTGEQLPRIC